MKKIQWILFAVIFLTWGALACHADEIYTIVVKKQEEKVKYRWTLADWFETRDKMRLQDLWFALHAPSPYEYFLGGSYQFNHNESGQSFRALEVYFAAYATIFGLEARLNSGEEQHLSGIFNLRVFGYHNQATNLTLQAGVQNTAGADYSYYNLFGGASLTFYLARHFGLEGLARHFFPSTENATGVRQSGDRFEAGLFLDFQALRLYGDVFRQAEISKSATGALFGARIYF